MGRIGTDQDTVVETLHRNVSPAAACEILQYFSIVAQLMQSIAFKIEPNKLSNDHQVRILIDNQDLIVRFYDSLLGLDPADFFSQPELVHGGTLIIARCACGVMGCGDVTVQVSRTGKRVVWTEPCPAIADPGPLSFDSKQFSNELVRARNDHSWETPARTAERLITALDFSALSSLGLEFVWASGRLHDDKISVSFRLADPGVYQVISSMEWDHYDPEQALQEIKKMIASDPQSWSDVVFHPQENNLPMPSLAGAGWRRG